MVESGIHLSNYSTVDMQMLLHAVWETEAGAGAGWSGSQGLWHQLGFLPMEPAFAAP